MPNEPGTYWNYRIIYHNNPSMKWFGIHEVHYTDDVLDSWVADPIYLTGETIEELHETHELIGRAFTRPVLYIKGDTLTEEKP